MTEMDRFCTFIIVIGAVVLMFMGYNEVVHMSMRNSSAGTCGMKSQLSTPTDGISAKASVKPHPVSAKEDTNEDSNDHFGPKPPPVIEPEPNPELDQYFSWEGDAAAEPNFKSPDKASAHKSANIRALGTNTQMREVSNKKNVGLLNPMLQLHGSGADSQIKFSKSCSWFGGTDAYMEAREKSSACNCLKEDCDACA